MTAVDALDLPIDQVALRSAVAGEQTPIYFDALAVNPGYACDLSRRYGTRGPGCEPIAWEPGLRAPCPVCGRRTALRRDGYYVRHHDVSTGTTCVAVRLPLRG